jgi:Fe-S cluster assembly protein SufD
MEIVESKNTTAPLKELIKSYAEPGKSDEAGLAQQLEDLRFPTRRDEYWKYTRTRGIEKTNWQFSQTPLVNDIAIPESVGDGPKLVFVNGHLSNELSVMEGMPEIEKVKRSDDSEPSSPFNPLADLNQVLPQNTYRIHLKKNEVVERVISIVHVFSGENTISQPYAEVVLEQGASLKINEFHLHRGSKTFSNSLTKYEVGSNAELGVDLIQEGENESYLHTQTLVNQEKDSRFTQNTFTLSGKWVRNNTIVNINGQNSEANLNGVYIPSGAEHVDNHTIIDHKVAHCESNELYRGVMMDKSTGVFNGKVFVRQDAQKTNAFQSNGNVLLSDFATINSKPELEIYADDVKCSHGSTTGQMDEEALFYLMSRGISEKNARILLVNAFAEDVLAEMVNENLRGYIESAIKEKLSGAGNGA